MGTRLAKFQKVRKMVRSTLRVPGSILITFSVHDRDRRADLDLVVNDRYQGAGLRMQAWDAARRERGSIPMWWPMPSQVRRIQ